MKKHKTMRKFIFYFLNKALLVVNGRNICLEVFCFHGKHRNLAFFFCFAASFAFFFANFASSTFSALLLLKVGTDHHHRIPPVRTSRTLPSPLA